MTTAPAAYDMYQVDAFSRRPLGGNPAAVVPLAAWLPDETLLRIAAENNLSETAFYVPRAAAAGGGYELRWFTPAAEVELCGHATLATAYVLLRVLRVPETEVHFHTRHRGVLRVSGDGADGALVMNFPAAALEKQAAPPAGLLEGLGVAPADVEEVLKSWAYVVVLRSAERVAAVTPDLTVIVNLDCRGGVCVTAPGAPGSGFDCYSRYFSPKNGVAEDPVTGSAHTYLTPYWGARLGKKRIAAQQGGRRRGELVCEDVGDGRVTITGHGALYMKAQIFLE